MKTFTCHACGHEWLEGHSGSHNCTVLLLKQLEQNKSLVKKVDADNLPSEVEVVAIDKDEGLLVGILFGDSCYSDLLENEEIGVDVCGHYIEHDNAKLDNVTKYIEQKDLIKLFGSVK